ncbi:unnamed protein product [Cyprideis torosa]|uniref:Cytokine-like nuclear factor N-PAC n=1 Tax=Cyprideis torosa TaxID=163714 RepID=A0A7R8WE93_9CRUS|nr:unnamed protein product [Cyprideis torosa]CAG0895542.1 unnamed protein product [Cyprideis torosa]
MNSMYSSGDLVWAKMKGFPPWPGQVVEPPDGAKKPTKYKGPALWVFFYGTGDHAWIEIDNIKPYANFREQLKKNKGSGLKQAVGEIEKYIADNPDALKIKNLVPVSSMSRTPTVSSSTPSLSGGARPVKVRLAKSTGAAKKRGMGESGTSSPSAGGSTPVKKPKPSPSTSSAASAVEEVSTTVSSTSALGQFEFEDADEGSVNGGRSGGTDAIGRVNHSDDDDVSYLPQLKKRGSYFLERPSSVPKPDVAPVDVRTVTHTLREKNIEPSKLKVGFLGLGLMGSGLVKNLLHSGHAVNVWNRTAEKGKDFVKEGAVQGLTPQDVVGLSDVIFSCVSSPQTAKDIVFGNCGVLPDMCEGKAYVEMTSVDPETSQDIAEAIQGKGGRYLEAQIQGDKSQAEEGTVVILTAGDRSLYDDCQSFFAAMGRNSFFLGEIGAACKLNLVLQSISGVAIAGLAEGMALADRAGLSEKDVLEIMELTRLNCPLLLDKGKEIIGATFTTQTALQHMQKDLRLALGLSDQLEAPLTLSATANELYKHAKRLGYGEHDVSAVYIRARF